MAENKTTKCTKYKQLNEIPNKYAKHNKKPKYTKHNK